MVNDPESNLYRELANIKELTKQVKSIKTKQNALTKRLSDIELANFHDRIIEIDKKIGSVNEYLMYLSQATARFEMDFLQYHILSCVDSKLSGSIREKVREQLKMKYSTNIERLKDVANPISISKEYRRYCVKYSQNYGLNAFG